MTVLLGVGCVLIILFKRKYFELGSNQNKFHEMQEVRRK